MSYSILRRLVQEELARKPQVVTGRVVDRTDAGDITMNFRGQSTDADSVRAMGMQTLTPQDTGFVLHLGEYRRPVFWMSANVDVGGQAEEV